MTLRRWLWVGVVVVLGVIALIGSRTLIPSGPPASGGKNVGQILVHRYNLNQSNVAVGHGGLSGAGTGTSRKAR